MNDEILQEVQSEWAFQNQYPDFKEFLSDMKVIDILDQIADIAHAYHERMKQEEAKAEQKQHLVELTRLGNEQEVNSGCFTDSDLDHIVDTVNQVGKSFNLLSWLNDKANQYAEERIMKSLEKAAENAILIERTEQIYTGGMREDGIIYEDVKVYEIDKGSITSKDNYQ